HRVLQIPILRGRSFTAQDGTDAPRSAVINEAMMRRYFAHENPIGRRISVFFFAPGGPIWHQIVGVVGDVRQKGLDRDVSPEIQIPYTQSATWQMAILVRTVIEPLAVAPSIRAKVQALDPNLPMTFIQT